jgi:hypothetical protein
MGRNTFCHGGRLLLCREFLFARDWKMTSKEKVPKRSKMEVERDEAA